MMTAVDIEAEYRAHGDDLVRYASVLVGPHEAQDVVNEAVLATMARTVSTGSTTCGRTGSALWRTRQRMHRSKARRSAREQRWSVGRAPVTTDPVGDDARRLLADLSVQQRAVMFLTYWHDWDPARIAAALGVAEGTVRKQLARGRDRLREVLDHG